MVVDVHDLRVKGGRCQICVQIEHNVHGEIKVVWQDLIKNFLEHRMVKIEGDWQKAITLFPNEKFPEEETDSYILKKVRGR